MNFKIFLAFIIYGIGTTTFSVLEWPSDGIHIPLNIPGNMLGHMIYQSSIDFIGDPTSSQAHYTIPWILRIPQVIGLMSALFWTGTGIMAQVFYNNIIIKKNPNTKH